MFGIKHSYLKIYSRKKISGIGPCKNVKTIPKVDIFYGRGALNRELQPVKYGGVSKNWSVH